MLKLINDTVHNILILTGNYYLYRNLKLSEVRFDHFYILLLQLVTMHPLQRAPLSPLVKLYSVTVQLLGQIS